MGKCLVFSFRVAALLVLAGAAPRLSQTLASELRLTPIVQAVRNARPAVVNIHGQKTIPAVGRPRTAEGGRRVNGMGTGVVVDRRGYVLTNFHVVDGVRRIHVTLDNGQTHVAQLVSHDPATDLAVLHLDLPKPLEVIRVGTSSDLMLGEPVVAIGNAYGYEHTVTTGIISHLHRDVQVSDTQHYDDLIQTSAPINPGNSGGPLLNIDGEMIGLNVAVRAGAQNIAFAIPIDAVMGVAARLMSVQRHGGKWHGLVVSPSGKDDQPATVEAVEPDSPAAARGFAAGDVLKRIGELRISRALDVERALLGRDVGEEVAVEVLRDGKPLAMKLALESLEGGTRTAEKLPDVVERRTWDYFGLRLEVIPRKIFARRGTQYRGGLRVVTVRQDGPAARQGIRRGDVLVGMHKWETASEQDLRYIVSHHELQEMTPLKFYILRGEETLYGHIEVAENNTARPASHPR